MRKIMTQSKMGMVIMGFVDNFLHKTYHWQSYSELNWNISELISFPFDISSPPNVRSGYQPRLLSNKSPFSEEALT